MRKTAGVLLEKLPMTRADQRAALRPSAIHAVARNPALRSLMAWLVFAVAFAFTAAMVFGLIG